jgi:hypothetical protein
MPPIVVFMLGLFEDVITHEPLGVWTAAALVAGLSGRLSWDSHGDERIVGNCVKAGLALTAVVVVVGVMTSIHGLNVVAWRPLAEALLVACLTYPLLFWLMSTIETLWPVVEERSLFMRGD